jgi:hypothetical protein
MDVIKKLGEINTLAIKHLDRAVDLNMKLKTLRAKRDREAEQYDKYSKLEIRLLAAISSIDAKISEKAIDIPTIGEEYRTKRLRTDPEPAFSSARFVPHSDVFVESCFGEQP